MRARRHARDRRFAVATWRGLVAEAVGIAFLIGLVTAGFLLVATALRAV